MIDMVVGNFLAILAFFGIIRFLKLLRFNRKVGMLTFVLKCSAKQWPGFFVLAAVFFVAFIHIGLANMKTIYAAQIYVGANKRGVVIASWCFVPTLFDKSSLISNINQEGKS